MILTGKEIEKRIKSGEIEIDPYNPENLGPNSYNLTLSANMMGYDDNSFIGPVLDAAKNNPVREFTIPDDGLVLLPGALYLARTVERTYTPNLVPMLEGRSSVGRLGIFVHITAGFGDTGFRGFWTLEITVVHPVKVYAGMKICQIYYHTVEGEVTPYTGKYANNEGIQSSQLYREFDAIQEKNK